MPRQARTIVALLCIVHSSILNMVTETSPSRRRQNQQHITPTPHQPTTPPSTSRCLNPSRSNTKSLPLPVQKQLLRDIQDQGKYIMSGRSVCCAIVLIHRFSSRWNPHCQSKEDLQLEARHLRRTAFWLSPRSWEQNILLEVCLVSCRIPEPS